MKNFGEKEAWSYPWTAQIFWVPPIISGREKLRISNLASIFRGFIRIKAHDKFWRKGSVGVSRDCPNFFGYPLLSQEREKLRISNWAGIFIGPGHLNISPLKILEKRTHRRIDMTAQFFRVPPIISGTGKATNFKFCVHIYGLNQNKSPL